jgi:predicted nuclease with TOPRIM domain
LQNTIKSNLNKEEIDKHNLNTEIENLKENMSMMSELKEKGNSMEDYVRKIKSENETLKENFKNLESKIEIKDKEITNSAISEVQIQDMNCKLE